MEQILVSAYTPSDPTKSTAVRAHRLSKTELVTNVLKKLGIYWGLAFLTFFIPVYNVFFVPFFFLIGVYVALKVEKARFEIMHGKIECPHCNEPIKLRKAVLTEDFQVTCPHCVTVVKLSVKASRTSNLSLTELYGSE